MQVRYVVPPFTPGGRVHVAFQFWIPISLSGFSVSGRELEAALRSPNPTAYMTKLFLKHVAANTTAAELLGHLELPVVEAAIDKFLDWVLPHLHHFTGSTINTVKTYTPRTDKKRKHKPWKIKRSLNRLSKRKVRHDTLPGLEPEEDDQNAGKKSSSDENDDFLTLSPKCPNETEVKELEITPETRKRRHTEETSLDGDTETRLAKNPNSKSHRRAIKERSFDRATEIKHYVSASEKTQRRPSGKKRIIEGTTDSSDVEIKKLVQDARNATPKSQKTRQTEEKNPNDATDLAGEQNGEESFQESKVSDIKSRIKRRAEEKDLEETTDIAEAQNEEPMQDVKYINLKSRRKRRLEETILGEATDLAGEQNEYEPAQIARSSEMQIPKLQRHVRRERDASEGWVTIGGGHGDGDVVAGDDSINPTSPLLSRPSPWSSRYRPSQLIPNDRLMWDDDIVVITHNDLSTEQDKRPGKDIQ